MTQPTLNVECIHSWLLEVLLLNRIFNPRLMTKGRWNVIENHEKTFWSFQKTSDVTWINLFSRIIDSVAITNMSSILPKARPTLSWDKALFLFLLVNGFPPGKVDLTLTPAFNTCVFESNKYCWITCIFAFTWLRWHQKDLKLNTRNKRMLALEKTNGPYAWLRQTSAPSLVCKILCIYTLCAWVFFSTLLPWELRKTLQHYYFKTRLGAHARLT